MTEDNEWSRRLGKAIRDYAREAPKDRDKQIEALLEVRRKFHAQLASAMEPLIQERFNTLLAADLETAKRTVSEIGLLLRDSGLGVVCPKTGLVGVLAVDHGDLHPNRPRFRIRINDTPQGQWQSFSSTDIWQLRLAPAPTRREGRQYVTRVNKSDRDAKRLPER